MLSALIKGNYAEVHIILIYACALVKPLADYMYRIYKLCAIKDHAQVIGEGGLCMSGMY